MKSFIHAVLFSVCTLFAAGCSQRFPGECERLYIEAVESYTANDLDTALIQVQKAKKLDSGFFQADLLEAKILFFQNRYEEAEKKLRKTVKKNPEFTEARIWHIRTLIFLEDYVKAESVLEKEIANNQTDWRIYYLYAFLSERMQNYNQRLAMSRRAEWALVDASRVYMDMAQMWNMLGMKEKGREYLLKAKTVSGSQSSLQELQETLEKRLAK